MRKWGRSVARATATTPFPAHGVPMTHEKLRCCEVARGQLGLITHVQARKCGMSHRQISSRIGCGEWTVVLPDVYRLAGLPHSHSQETMAACLWAGPEAAVSHRSAASHWGLVELEVERPEITTHRNLRSTKIIVHRSYCLRVDDVTCSGGLRVTTPTRTLLDLGSILSSSRLERALERALHKRVTDIDSLAARFNEWARRGRPGARKWRALLELRDSSLEPTASDFETRMSQLIRRYNLPAPVRQHVIMQGTRFLARADFAYPAQRVLIECDSEQWHRGREPWQRDMWRYNTLVAAGWKVLRFTWWDVTSQPDYVAGRIVDVLQD
jgi:very-short-patch-repair endonuclease